MTTYKVTCPECGLAADEVERQARRATVDRIRLRLASVGFGKDGYDIDETHAILDEEAAR